MNRIALVSRLLLGALFVTSGVAKLRDPAFFAIAIEAFEFDLAAAQLRGVTFFVPWLEIVTGAFLVLGVWTRAALLVSIALMTAFCVVIGAAIVRGVDVDCPCFGSIDFICTGTLGVCHIARNVAIAAVAVIASRAIPRQGKEPPEQRLEGL